MKKVCRILLGVWCSITSFISPIWLTLMFLNITGQIYKYDYSMDDGTAGVIGVLLLGIWILFAALPGIIFIKKMRIISQKAMFAALAFFVLFAVICIAMCDWNMVKFLSISGGTKFGF